MMAPKNDDNLESWRDYRIKLLDLMEKHEKEIAKLHDAVLVLQIRDAARGTGLVWIGGVIGSVLGGIAVAVVLKVLHL